MLVRPRDFQAAECALRDSGFQPAPGERPSERMRARTLVLEGAPVPIAIDLHGGIAPWPIAARLAARMLDGHERIAGWRLPRLADAFCLTALHRARHGFLWSAVDLFELKAVSSRMDDSEWREVLACASACHCAGAVWAAYRQAVWLFGADGHDDAHVASLGRLVGAVRRRMLARVARGESVLDPDPFWRRPIPRMLIVGPCSTASIFGTLAAAAMFLPPRIAELWNAPSGKGRTPLGRARAVLDSAWRGDETAYARDQPADKAPSGSHQI
jgi:hypothetical protein